MIVDDFNSENLTTSSHSYPKKGLLNLIIKSIKLTTNPFLSVLTSKGEVSFNEDVLTQFFVPQNQFQCNNLSLPIFVGTQYRDTYHDTKGIPDIYYTILESGKDFEPVFLMEAKRLPAPTSDREREYVHGLTPSGNPNGGIERFKLGRQGFGFNECGLLGYVERENPSHWFGEINTWIIDVANDGNSNWNEDECLYDLESNINSSYCLSNVRRSADVLKMHHFWVIIQPNPN